MLSNQYRLLARILSTTNLIDSDRHFGNVNLMTKNVLI